MRRPIRQFVLASFMAVSALGPVCAQQPTSGGAVPLIPRETLFGNPDRIRAALSPDGKRIAFLAAHQGVLNVFVAPAEKPEEAKPVTAATRRGIMRFQWAQTGRHLLYLLDLDGDENWHVYCADVDKGTVVDLTPFDTIAGADGKPLKDAAGRTLRPSARIIATSPKHPAAVILAVNNRDPRLHDLYRADVIAGTVQLLQTCPEGVVDWVIDNDLNAVSYTHLTLPTTERV